MTAMAGMPMPPHHDHPAPGAYKVVLEQQPAGAGTAGPLKFKLIDAKGAPVTDYDTVHEKQLHLFAVRDTGTSGGGTRFTDFQHLHPTYAGNGEWQLDGFTAPSGGTERIFADFSTKGTAAVAQAAYEVQGGAQPARDDSRGYKATVVKSMAMGDAVHAVVQLTGPDGKPVASVVPFLGAPAHWALFGDVAKDAPVPMAHAHPMGDIANGQLNIHVELPAKASYEGWIQFQPTDGQLVTVPIGLAPKS